MTDAGIRGQIFVAIVISVVIGIAAAGVAGYHVFERGLEGAYQARLRSLVDEASRVLDAGIRAGLAADQPHLMQKALAGETSADPIGPTEVVSIVDTRGIVIASTNSAEIGEAAPAAWSMTASSDAAAGPALLIASHEVMSLFGTVEATIVARVPGEVMAARTTTFLFQLLVASTVIGGGTIVLAFLLVWLIPWPAVRRAEALRAMMDGLYDEVGGAGTAGPPRPLPRQIEGPALRFRTTILEIYGHLLHEREEVSRLDEAA
jgi:hypothetical protein